MKLLALATAGATALGGALALPGAVDHDAATSQQRQAQQQHAQARAAVLSTTAGQSSQARSTGGSAAGTSAGNRRGGAELQDVQLVRHRGFDTIRLEFASGTSLPEHQVEYRPRPLRMEGSNKPADLQGAPGPELAVDLTGASDRDTPAGAELVDPSRMSTVAQVKNLGSFEGHVKLGIALVGDQTPPVSVSTGGRSISINIDYGPPEDPPARGCGNVTFEPESDAGAFDIAARGVGCETARDVAAFAEGQVGDPYGTPSGYACLPERDSSGPTTEIEYTCTRADATITFDA